MQAPFVRGLHRPCPSVVFPVEGTSARSSPDATCRNAGRPRVSEIESEIRGNRRARPSSTCSSMASPRAWARGGAGRLGLWRGRTRGPAGVDGGLKGGRRGRAGILSDLRARGLGDPLLVVSDERRDHPSDRGLFSAIGAPALPGASIATRRQGSRPTCGRNSRRASAPATGRRRGRSPGPGGRRPRRRSPPLARSSQSRVSSTVLVRQRSDVQDLDGL
jgi:hypothetical protein